MTDTIKSAPLDAAQEKAGPWAVERYGKQWAVKRPGSSVVFLIRATKVAAENACKIENRRWRENRVREVAPDMLAALKIFLGSDSRFKVAVCGNPLAVDRWLEEVRAIVAKADGQS